MVLIIALILSASSAVLAGNSSANTSCQAQTVVGYGSLNGCTYDAIRKGPLRVIYLDSQYVTQNQAARAKVESMGMNYSFGETCDDAATAVAEW